MEKTWRWTTPDDRQRLGKLYAEGFSLHSPFQFYEDFPLWDPGLPTHPRLQLICVSPGSPENGAVATASVAVREMAGSRRRIGIIGGVVVTESQRGKGLAREALQRLLGQSERDFGIRDWVLWTGSPKLYEHFGFHPLGEQVRATGVRDWVLNESNILNEEAKHTTRELLKVAHGFSADLFRKIQERPAGFRLESSHLELYQHLQNVDWWRVENSLHEVKAYVGIGRGIDLPNIIHEWGGELEYLVPLMSEVLKVHPNPEWIFSTHLAERFPYLVSLETFSVDPLCYWRSAGDPLSESEMRNIWFWGGDSS